MTVNTKNRRFSDDLRSVRKRAGESEGLPCFPSAGHSGRQRRPHKALWGFCNLVTKPQFRGCLNFNLADLGVTEFSADFAGYSEKCVVLCWAWKGVILMQKKLLTNGNAFKRTDGRWCGVVWYMDEHGRRKRKSFSGTTKAEVNKKMTDYIADFDKQAIESDESRKTLRESMQQWLRVFKFPSATRGVFSPKLASLRRSSIIATAVRFSGTVRLLVALLGFPIFTSRPLVKSAPFLLATSFTPCRTVSVFLSKSMSLFSRPSNSPVRKPVLSIKMYAAAC